MTNRFEIHVFTKPLNFNMMIRLVNPYYSYRDTLSDFWLSLNTVSVLVFSIYPVSVIL